MQLKKFKTHKFNQNNEGEGVSTSLFGQSNNLRLSVSSVEESSILPTIIPLSAKSQIKS
jgi:hypothetical protein